MRRKPRSGPRWSSSRGLRRIDATERSITFRYAKSRPRSDARGAMAAFARAGDGNERRGASRAGNSATVASPGPAPKTIVALSSGWLAIRPRWIVHRYYSGPWRPRRGRHPLRSRSPARAFRDVAPGPGLPRRAFAAHCRWCAGVIKKRSGGSSIIGIYPSLSVSSPCCTRRAPIDVAT